MFNFLSSVTIAEQAIFSRQLADMVSAGIPISRSLALLSEQGPNPRLRSAIALVKADVERGVHLSYALRQHPQCFDKLYISLVSAGEMSGVLEQVLHASAKLMEARAGQQKQQQQPLLSYPQFFLGILVILWLALMMTFPPILLVSFAEMGIELPVTTQLVLEINHILTTPNLLLHAICILVALGFTYQECYQTPRGRVKMDKVYLKLPVLGELIKKRSVAHFCYVLGTLLRAGVPLVNAWEIAGYNLDNRRIKRAIAAAQDEIQTGATIGLVLQKERVFPNTAIETIRLGEKTNELDKVLLRVGAFYENEYKNKLEQTSEILTMLASGAMMILILLSILSMYLPLYKTVDYLR